MKRIYSIVGICAGSFLVLLLGGVFVAYIYIQSTPQYSVYELYTAIHARDYTTFSKYFDVNTVAINLVNQVAAQDAPSENPITANIQSALKPQMIQEVDAEIQNEVSSGSFQYNYTSRSLLDYFRYLKVSRETGIVTVTMEVPGSKPFSLIMKPVGNYWRVIALKIAPALQAGSGATGGNTTPVVGYTAKASLGGGWYLSVTSPATFQSSDPYVQPARGDIFVAIEATYDNTSTAANTYSIEKITMKDIDNHSYVPVFYGGKTPSLQSGTLEPHGEVKGYLTYEIPANEAIKSVIYSGNSGTVIFGN